MRYHVKIRRDGKRPDSVVMVGTEMATVCSKVAELNAKYDTEDYYAEAYDTDNPPHIIVYKREPDDPRGFAKYRPWNVAQIPEDTRETCYPSWEAAMEWATMTTKERQAFLDEENRMDGGW